MSARSGRWLVLALLMASGLGGPRLAADEDQPPQSYAQGATRKLGRGVANVATAPLELIRVPYLMSQRDGGLAGLSVGMVQGAWAAVVRELAGAVEVTTFLIPLPKDFQPLIRPEFVYANGDWSP
ncbi:MAG: exosortase system-associated protein, TIGR04073 family [Candidatus Omnitrophica bacterium]|nr:exosortase system-associated protein, TIGR04073 family [Candidatus Omnitrophota bacterium]